MTSEELAKEILNAVLAVQQRILTVGKEQYARGDQQQFEGMSLQEIAKYAREEAEDLIAYGVMLRIKTQALIEALDLAFSNSIEPKGKHAKPRGFFEEPDRSNSPEESV